MNVAQDIEKAEHGPGLGTRLGPYEIGESIGAGGMGEVYRATDTNLKRDVAIKVLPQSFASDAERLARFQREAEVLASLNHVNIAHIYGLERSHDTTALAMELVAGLTLAERIARGPIHVDEALEVARQIAEALEAAHARGIVHRDLKPANIKITPDGTVKVLDFGIAKALDLRVTSGPQALTTPAMTEAGMVLGTAAYMSPEQARGRQVDERADIWAFGCVLYEMLTGQAVFGGENANDTLVHVLERGADLAALPASVVPAVRQTIELCLQKDLKKRVADIRDVRLALEGAFETAVAAAWSTPRGQRTWMTALAVAVLAMVALGVPALRHLRETPPPLPPETRVDIVTPATDDPTSFALSPDGQKIVFVASGDGVSRLWLRSLATTTAQPLSGTEGATAPFWSPDSGSIGFFAAGSLKRLDLGGGAPQTLAPAQIPRGGTWNEDGVIVFAALGSGGLVRVSATGGAVAAVTTPGVRGRLFPNFLPDGRRFLFAGRSEMDGGGIYLGALDGSAPTRLTAVSETAALAAVYLPSGWLLWVRSGALVAQRMDLEQAVLTGEPVIVADGVTVNGFGQIAVSSAATGLLAYRTAVGGERHMTWVDRSGTVQGAIGEPDRSNLSYPRISPDGQRVVVSRVVQGNRDLWLLDGARMSRFTFDAAVDSNPLWSHDGMRIAFRSTRTGVGNLYQKLMSGAVVEEALVISDVALTALSWSPDGQFLLYASGDDPQTGVDLWIKPIVGDDQAPCVFLQTASREAYGAFSPDGQWVAYYSNESGRNEIYVRPFIAPCAPSTAVAATVGWQVSTDGGIDPVWRRDGQELYYVNAAGEMVAVPMTVTGSTLVPGAPATLFPTRIYGGGQDLGLGWQYDVAPDGRFLINTVLDDGAAAPITLIQNWSPEARQ